VAKGFFQIQGQDYDEMLAPMVCFDSLRLLLSIIAENGFDPQQTGINAAFLYCELKETIYMHLPEVYRDGNTVAHLNRYIYGLKTITQRVVLSFYRTPTKTRV
jgi:hypothetical protein